MLKQCVRSVSTLLRAARMARKPIEALTAPFKVDAAKKAAFLRQASSVRVLVLGSSHAYNGYLASAGEFNYGLRNCDLYHAAHLFRRMSEARLLSALETVIVFYDVFSPGFVMEKTSRGSLAIAYRYLWDIEYQAPLRIDHRVIERRTAGTFAALEAAANPGGDYRGNADYARGAKPPPTTLPRVAAHLKHNRRADDQTRHLELIHSRCCQIGVRMVVVIAPARSDYLDLLPVPRRNLFARLDAFCAPRDIEVLDFTGSGDFSDSDFLDSDHLSREGAEKLTLSIRQRLGLA